MVKKLTRLLTWSYNTKIARMLPETLLMGKGPHKFHRRFHRKTSDEGIKIQSMLDLEIIMLYEYLMTNEEIQEIFEEIEEDET